MLGTGGGYRGQGRTMFGTREAMETGLWTHMQENRAHSLPFRQNTVMDREKLSRCRGRKPKEFWLNDLGLLSR